MKLLLIATAASLALTFPAAAKDWQIDYAHSTLTFTGDQSGQKFQGGFKKFTAQIDFNPEQPETGKITVSIDTGSAFAGDEDRDAMLPQKDWFNVGAFPQAQFITKTLRKTGNGTYEAVGTVAIKGIKRDVLLPFTLSPEGNHWHALGHVKMMRNDFAIGQGSFVNENYVKFPVDVTVDMAAVPAS